MKLVTLVEYTVAVLLTSPIFLTVKLGLVSYGEFGADMKAKFGIFLQVFDLIIRVCSLGRCVVTSKV